MSVKKTLIELEEELEQIEEENKQRKPMDELITDVVTNGKYQILIMLLFGVNFIFNATYMMSNGLFFQTPGYECDGQPCTEKDYCNGDYTDKQLTGVNSVTKALHLVCGKNYANAIGESLPYIGSLIGLMVFMMLGDKIGRKPVLGMTLGICAIGSILTICFENVVTIYTGMFLVGVGITPVGFIQIVILNEISTGHFRTFSMCFMYVCFAIGEMLIWPFSAIVEEDWRLLYLFFLTIPYCICFGIYFLVLETPKYLQPIDQQKTAEVLQKMADYNKQEVKITEKMIEKSDTLKQNSFDYTHLFRFRSLRGVSLAMCSLSFGIHALYYGMQVSLDLIGSQVAKNCFFVGIADFLGYVLSDIVCPKLPRKKNLVITLSIASILCFSFIFDPVPEECQPDDQSCPQKTIQIIQAMFARFVISFSFSFMIIWLNELYPTSIRSIGVGFVAAIGFLGAYVTPYIKQFSTDVLNLNFVILCGFFGVMGVASAFSQKETFGKPFKQEIDELTRRYSVRLSLNPRERGQSVKVKTDTETPLIKQQTMSTVY